MKICPKCQVEFPDEMTYCGRCASPLVTKGPSGPDTTVVPPLGSVGARLFAHLLDILFFLVPAYFLLGNVYGAFFGGLTESGFSLNRVPTLIVIGVTLLLFSLYLVLFEAAVGATPGKFILGLRVKRVGGSACGFGPSLLRNLLRIVDGIAVYLVGLIAALVTKKKQRVGDLAAGTIVMKEHHGVAKRAMAGLFLVACVVGAIIGSLYVRKHPRVSRVSFGIANLRLADSESAPPRASAEFKPEDDVRMFYEVPGYERDPISNIAVITKNQVLAPDGRPLYEIKTIEVRQRAGKDSGPVKCSFHIQLPGWAPAGKYTLKIDAEDQVAHKIASASAFFTVNAIPVETSTTLVAKNIELANGREAPALNPPVFVAGQSVWLRFHVLGMKANDKRQVYLTEDWGVVGPDGKALFQRNEDSMINEQFVYPPPFIPYREYVEIPSWADPGEYKFHVVLHDRIGGADFTLDQPFTVKKP